MRRFLAILLFVAGCFPERDSLDRAALIDPVECQSCHPDQYREWSGSMHAYASDDPVFLAINALGQRETGGALGDFCVGCHAPMAVRLGYTQDGLNLEDVPRAVRGVTCFFCHQVDQVLGDHNNALGFAGDGVMRGGISDPADTGAHRSAYSELHDVSSLRSSEMCGACHDVVTPSGLHLERTYAEWRESLFAQPDVAPLSCGGCHMPSRSGPAFSGPGARERRVHDHSTPGVDVALSPWPETDTQLWLVERDLDATLAGVLCVLPDGDGAAIHVTLDNVLAGHAWPSGVTHARRAWVEVVAWQGDEVIFESGVVPDGVPAAGHNDPTMWLMRSRAFGAGENETLHSWEAVRMESELLPPPVTNDPADPRYDHSVTRVYTLPGRVPFRVRARVRIRPVALEIADALVASGDLDPAVRDRIPTFDLAGTTVEWTSGDGFGCVP